MKGLVFSDTHGVTEPVSELIREIHPEYVVFLGDCVRDIESVMVEFPDIILYAVKGNNDIFSRYPDTLFFRIGGRSVFAVHGHGYNITALSLAAAEKGADTILFGHTHRVFFETGDDGVIIMNPGSVRDTASYGIIDESGASVHYFNEKTKHNTCFSALL